MKAYNIGLKLIWLLAAYWIVYNYWFGFNLLPINKAEKICNIIFMIGMDISAALILWPLIEMYPNMVKEFYEKKKQNKQ